jgi:hypothetical protein
MHRSSAPWLPLPLLIFMFLACERHEDTLDDLTLLTGDWTGTQEIHRAGNCTIGGADHVQSHQRLFFSVNGVGETVVLDSTGSYILFRGRITNDLDVSLTTWYTVGCGDSTHADSAFYDGFIRIYPDYYALIMDAIELWCPPDCIFEVIYELRLDIE